MEKAGAVEDRTGGNNCALAQKIAGDHPGAPGNHIHQFVKPYERSSYFYTVLFLIWWQLSCSLLTLMFPGNLVR